jgi:hypothetical protein
MSGYYPPVPDYPNETPGQYRSYYDRMADYYSKIFTPPPPVDELWMWLWGDTLTHCPRCISRNGAIMTMAEWKAIGTPPLHRYCACTLYQVN